GKKRAAPAAETPVDHVYTEGDRSTTGSDEDEVQGRLKPQPGKKARHANSPLSRNVLTLCLVRSPVVYLADLGPTKTSEMWSRAVKSGSSGKRKGRDTKLSPVSDDAGNAPTSRHLPVDSRPADASSVESAEDGEDGPRIWVWLWFQIYSVDTIYDVIKQEADDGKFMSLVDFSVYRRETQMVALYNTYNSTPIAVKTVHLHKLIKRHKDPQRCVELST
ncbi:hypothetical protein SISNIDRAFT_471930, partial [Sistotremastrum niveocremeum HHB9708]